MKVMASKGLQCPKEGKPREYITDSVAVDVPNTPYYQRLLKDGSLVSFDVQAASKNSKGGK